MEAYPPLLPNIEASLSILTRCFPHWQQPNQKTIFIPAYHASIRNNLGPAEGNRNPADFKGGQAERDLFYLLQRVEELGGIVVGNADKRNILKKMPESIKSAYIESGKHPLAFICNEPE
jgi:hypothetical protein